MVHAVSATLIARTMPGGTRSQLAVCDDGEVYVVKCPNNQQGPNVLANEFIAAGLMKALELPTARWKIVVVPREVAQDYETREQFALSHRHCDLHFGSEMLRPSSDGRLYSYLPSLLIRRIENRAAFLGALIFDIWAGSTDKRQAVYVENHTKNSFRAVFIDNGHLFGGPNWQFSLRPSHPFSLDHSVYEGMIYATVVETWIAQIQNRVPLILPELLRTVPKQWYQGDIERLEELLLIRLENLTGLFWQEIANASSTLRKVILERKDPNESNQPSIDLELLSRGAE